MEEYILVTVLNWFFVKEVNPYSDEHEVRIVSNFEHQFDNRFSFVSLTDEVLKSVYVGKNVSKSDYQVV
ncbi:MAG: hypothetical protein EOO85_17430 [Pedobacter sp.]|nr:MAG: hypothetical protein EOO85_17430 [Pedobacter sp.]